MKTNRLVGLDVVRFFAMIMVIAIHENFNRLDNVVSFHLSQFSNIAIPLFFISFGFLFKNRFVSFDYAFRKIYHILRFIFIIIFIFWIFQNLSSPYHSLIIEFIKPFIQKGHHFIFWYFGAIIIIYLILPILHPVLSNKQKCKKILCSLFVLETIVLGLNAFFNFESHIIQTFRIWNWLFYFVLGYYWGLNINDIPKINFSWVILAFLLFDGFAFIMFHHIKGSEMLFCSLPCMIYSSTFFLYFQKIEIRETVVTRNIHLLFLPIYSFHIQIMHIVRFVFSFENINEYLIPFIELFLVLIISILIFTPLMKITVVRKFFTL